MTPRRSAARALAAAALAAVAFAAAAAAQIPRPQKAKLAFEPATLRLAPGEEAKLDAVVTIDPGWHVQAHLPSFDYLIPTTLRLELPPGFAEVGLTYPAPSSYKFAFVEERLDVYQGTIRIGVRFRPPAAGASGRLTIPATLRYQACDDKQCLPPVDAVARLELQIGAAPGETKDEKIPLKEKMSERSVGTVAAPAEPAPARAPASLAPAPAPTRSLGAILLLALLGGFILNGMPCVLPILSLKVFGLVKAAGQSRRAVRAGALATAAGILISFWALAAVAIVARGAGVAIGWGVQFQQPGFVGFLAVVVLLFSLNLWGLFEIPLPARLARLGDAAAASGAGPAAGTGLGGHFASGLFATLMATPCSAPFLGTALSFALGQSATTIALTLTAVGAGLALPYLALAVAPGAVRWLPRPGAWMDTLRGTMGFLLAGALVWLLYVLTAQVVPEGVAFFELALLALALAVWVASRRPLGSAARRVAWVLVALFAAAAVVLVARAPVASARAASARASGIAWVPFDRAEAERLAASGRLVFLDVSADWCVTCKVNERVILGSPEVLAAFREHAVVAMKADWTNRDDGIARFLADHGRYGIPFYLLYRPGRSPHLFGELVSKRELVDLLAASARPPA